MSRVICTLPNASNLINGVVFAPHKLGVISDEVEQEVADAFLACPGYRSYDEVKAEASRAAAAASAPITPTAGTGAESEKQTVTGAPDIGPADNESTTYADGTAATGPAPLPSQSPDEQAAADAPKTTDAAGAKKPVAQGKK